MEDSPKLAEKTAKRKLRWYQFSLRSLLIFVTIVGIACSWVAVKIEQAKKQKAAIQTIERLGKTVWYDYQAIAPRTVSTGQPPEPEWLLNLLGQDFFHKPVNVTLFGSPPDDEWIGAVNSLPSLTTLLLSEGNVSDRTLEKLAPLPNLEELHANSSAVSDEGLKELTKFPKLRWLVIHYTKVTDSGMAHVRNLKHLEELVLQGDDVSDAAIPDLAAMTTLTLLDVRQTAITAEGCTKLQKALPGCKILWQAR